MKPGKFLLAIAFTFILAGESYPAQKKDKPPDNRARNIYQLFMSVNPKLEASSAQKYAQIVIEAAEKFKQDPYVIAGIVVHESTVNNKAVSKGGDYGLMQVRWKIHEKAIKQRFPKVKKANDMFDARTNIFFGTEIFSDCMKKTDGDFQKGLMRYSAGNTKLRDKVTATVKKLYAQDNTVKPKAANKTVANTPVKSNTVTNNTASNKTSSDKTAGNNASNKTVIKRPGRSDAAEMIYRLQQEAILRTQEKKKEK